MSSGTIYFRHNARRVFTAAKWALQRVGVFSRIDADERRFCIKASRGLPVVGENVELRVVATGVDEACVKIVSTDKLFYNIFKWGNNKRNVNDITEYLQNEIYRYLRVDDSACHDRRSVIRIVPPEIKLSK